MKHSIAANEGDAKTFEAALAEQVAWIARHIVWAEDAAGPSPRGSSGRAHRRVAGSSGVGPAQSAVGGGRVTGPSPTGVAAAATGRFLASTAFASRAGVRSQRGAGRGPWPRPRGLRGQRDPALAFSSCSRVPGGSLASLLGWPRRVCAGGVHFLS